jgi:Protein of unknown function (DUF3106)
MVLCLIPTAHPTWSTANNLTVLMTLTSRTQKISSLVLFAFFCLTQANPSLAQSPSSPAHGRATAIPEKKPDGTWDGLKPSQQQILAPLESDWDYMLPDSRKKWIQVATIYPKMSSQDQERLQSRMASWSNLSQKERRIARENYLASLKFPAEKKAEAWSAYQKLSDDQKKKLAESEAKKKPTAANAPTLQQHPISPKVALPATVLAPNTPAPSESSGSNAESAPSNNETK